MIVRDAADFVTETLDSVIGYIDDWVIVDTGSVDNTPSVITDYFAARGIAGELVHRPWIGFAPNRTEALALCRGRADYAFMIDADDLVSGRLDLTGLSEPGYRVRFGPSFVYWRPAFFKLDREWQFRGVVHEYAVATDASHTVNLEGDYHFTFRSLGGRGKDPAKFQRDIDALMDELERDPDDPRTVFYLGQSHRDLGDLAGALHWYQRRADMSGWVEETYIALLEVARLKLRLDEPVPEVVSAFERAATMRPQRAEALVELARFHRHAERWAAGLNAARRATSVPFPDHDILFVDANVHTWNGLDEFAICASRLGEHDEAIAACGRLLEKNHLPLDQRPRVLWNQTWSMMQLGEPRLTVRAEPPPLRVGETIDLTFTITTSRRRESFERTMDALLENCLDHHLIARWICIDDGSSSEDRMMMQQRYPFFEFIFKDESDRGHAKSMNRLLATVDSEYWLHFEDDWQFVKPSRYISRAVEVLDDDPTLIQTVLNRNYAETLANHDIVGGHMVVSARKDFAYRVHDHVDPASPEFGRIFEENPGRLTNAQWPGFSLMPSVMRRRAFDQLGAFNPGAGHFERDMADRALALGWRTACLDDITMLNIGRLRTDTGPDAPLNAYQLLGVQQFRTYPDVRVRLAPNWCTGDELAAVWRRQLPVSGHWKGLRFVGSNDEADHTLVINHPGPNPIGTEDRVLLAHMEPVEGVRTYGPWAEPANDSVEHFHAREFGGNLLEWHLDATYDELITSHPAKTRELSAIVTGKRLSPGHHLRLDFLHHLEHQGVPVDVFGLDNDENFTGYRGALPWLDKRDGLFPYRYTIAVENNAEPNYLTEKIVDGILAECLVFYWGCPNIHDFVEPEAITLLPLDDFEMARNIIENAVRDDEHGKRLPAIRRAKLRLLDDLQLAPELSRVVRGHRHLRSLPVHLVNLDRRPDRLEITMERLATVAPSDFVSKVTRFPAIDGRELEIDDEIHHMFRGSELPLRRAQTATALGHLALWFELMNSDDDWCLILEDDIDPRPHFASRLGSLLGQLDDDPGVELAFLGLHYFGDDMYPTSAVQRWRSVDLRGVMGGTFAYLMSKRAAHKLFDIAQRDGIPCGIDTFILRHVDEVRSVEAVPHLVTSPVARYGGPVVDSDIQYE